MRNTAEAATVAAVEVLTAEAVAADFMAVAAVSTAVAEAADVQLRRHLVVAATAAGAIIPVRPIAAAHPLRIGRFPITPVVGIPTRMRDARPTLIRITLVQLDLLTRAIARAVRPEQEPTRALRRLTWAAAAVATRLTLITQFAAA